VDNGKNKEHRKRMPPRRILFTICLIVSVVCLAAGYGLAGQWIGAGVAILTGPAWLFVRKYPASGLPLIGLFAAIFLAVVGRLVGSPGLLMICSAGFSLAVWDLLDLNFKIGNQPSGEQVRLYENNHLQSLALGSGAGLLVASLGHFISFKIPFLILALCIALAVIWLDRVWRNVGKMK
jgi:hypothetical protein